MNRRMITSVTLLMVAVNLSSCASGGGTASSGSGGGGGSASPSLAYGYMIPGAGLASAMGVRATDSIPELAARATVTTTLANAITQEVAAGRWNNQCTRRFGGPSVYLVNFHRECNAAAGPDADPQVVVGFSSDGKTIGRALGRPQHSDTSVSGATVLAPCSVCPDE